MKTWIWTCLLLYATNGSGQVFNLVKDINTSQSFYYNNPSAYSYLTEFNGDLYFAGYSPIFGQELWKFNKQTGQKKLIKDIYPGEESSGPTAMTVYNNFIFFSATDATSGTELWKTDGTASGTIRVRDINPGKASSFPNTFIICNNSLFFVGNGELWKTDGTEQGTVLVKDIYPGSQYSMPSYPCVKDGILFFAATNPSNGTELWRSDGTESGTYLLLDINPISDPYTGPKSGNPRGIMLFNGYLYFNAANQVSGEELWKSDGTSFGTILLKDINPGLASSYPHLSNVILNNKLFFSIKNNSSSAELWSTDGSATGTSRVKDFYPGAGSSSVNDIIVFKDSIYLQASSQIAGRDIWKSDGTDLGTQKLIHLQSSTASPGLIADQDYFYFADQITSFGEELWVSDGTVQGTKMVKDLEPGSKSSYPKEKQSLSGQIYFEALTSQYGRSIWKTDGSSAGTVNVINFVEGTSNSNPTNLTAIGNIVYFSANDSIHGEEIWRSNGTELGTVLVDDLSPGADGSFPKNFTVSDSNLYFSALQKLWKINSPSGSAQLVHPTVLVGDQKMLSVNGIVFFEGSTGFSLDLWKTNGTQSGTNLVPDKSGSGYGQPKELTAFQGTIFFSAYNNSKGWQLWKVDTTLSGAVPVKDIEPLPYYSPLGWFRVAGNYLYFVGENSTTGLELWKSDGTETGTTILEIIPGSAGSFPSNLTAVGDVLYFTAFDSTHGTELWKTDGTVNGTLLVKDITPGITGTEMRNFMSANGMLFFDAYDSLHGLELWKTDGTANGTVMVKDAWPGVSGQSTTIRNRIIADGNIILTRNDGISGEEPWLCNGSAEGTLLISDIIEGSGASAPNNYLVAGNKIYFTAYQQASGKELWLGNIQDIYPKLQLSFQGRSIENDAALDWETMHEKSIGKFDIQRSTNGLDFVSIGQKQANGGLGIHAAYHFVDSNIHLYGQPIISYRLNIKKNEGDSSFSDTVLLIVAHPVTTNSIIAFPIPSHADLTLNISLLQADKLNFVLYDMQGRSVMKWSNHFEKGFYTKMIKLQPLNAGVYYLHVQGSSLQELIKIVKL